MKTKIGNQQGQSQYAAAGLALTLVLLLGVSSTGFADSKVFDVRELGAKGDGKALDTEAIQKALDEAGKVGGTVKFPAGTYLSKPLTLRTKTTAVLDEGATLLATSDQAAFLKSGTNWLEAKSASEFVPFIGGNRLADITITGKGTIDGNGKHWWEPAEQARRKQPGYTLPRPRLIVINNSKNIKISGITLQNSPTFHFVPTDCENVVVEGVTVLAPPRSPNTDAIDPSRCKNVLITKCILDVGDDNIAIKSGRKIPEREFACEDITVTDCIFRNGHGMSIGSEVVGGVRNVTVKNCTFEGTENGLRIKSRRDRGGVVENITYTDITMKNVDPAILLSCQYGGTSSRDAVQGAVDKPETIPPVTETTPIYRNIRFSNVTATADRMAALIEGLPESAISNVVFENVRITSATGFKIQHAKGIQLKNVEITPKQGPPFILENAEVEGLPKMADKK